MDEAVEKIREAGELISHGPFVSHVTQAHPNDLVDPYWIDQVLARGYREFLYRQWPVEVDDIEPELIEDRLPEGASLLRRSAFLNTRRVQAVIEQEGALAAMQLTAGLVWVGVAASELGAARALLDDLVEAFPEADSSSEKRPRVHIGLWSRDEHGRLFRGLEVEPWEGLEANYAASTRDGLAPLLDEGFSPEGRGQLLVWHGAPGTGKSFAIGSLAWAWRSWASFFFIADPEALLEDPGYLMEFMLARPANDDRWRVAVLEDAGELFGADARQRAGQALSRLLNATDGMLARGSKTLFLITTNEPIDGFHAAVVRPGRCASRVSFDPLPIEQAKAWLLERGRADVAKRLSAPVTLAELFALAEGRMQPVPQKAVGGLYL